MNRAYEGKIKREPKNLSKKYYRIFIFYHFIGQLFLLLPKTTMGSQTYIYLCEMLNESREKV